MPNENPPYNLSNNNTISSKEMVDAWLEGSAEFSMHDADNVDINEALAVAVLAASRTPPPEKMMRSNASDTLLRMLKEIKAKQNDSNEMRLLHNHRGEEPT